MSLINIEDLKDELAFLYPNFAKTIYSLEYTIENNIPTCATTGKVVLYNEDFFAKLTRKQILFCLAHEILHIAFRHLDRLKDKDIYIWNIATDAIINALLINDDLSPVEGIIIIDDALSYTSEELYNKLLEETKDNEKEKTLHASHDRWNEKEVKKPSSNEENSPSNKYGKNKSTASNFKEDINFDDSKINEKELFDKNISKRNENENNTLDTSSFSTLAGKTSSKKKFQVKITKAKPILDWRKYLKESINLKVDYSYDNAYIEDGILRADLIDIPVPQTEILIDTSGSVDIDLVRCFLHECKNIMKTSKLKVGCFDIYFYGFKELRKEIDLDNFELKGRGGTSFKVAISSFTKRVENKIIFTDGKAEVPNVKDAKNIIWVIYNNDKFVLKGAKVIYVNQKDLYKNKNKIKSIKGVKK